MLNNQPFLWEGPSRDRACLLLHGLGGGTYELQLLGEFLLRQGWTVQCTHYPGHDGKMRLGGSSLPSKMPASTWPQWYSCVLDTYKALARTHTAISVVGFSTGCQLALHLATQYPVRRLALLSPYVRLRYRWYYGLPPESYILSLGRWIDDVPRLWLPIRDRQMEAAARQVVFFNTFNLAAVRSAMELIESVKPTLSKIATPTSILQADNDSVVDPSGAAELYQCLGSPIKELHWLPQSDHIIPLDLERETVFARVGAFLQK